jgi:hypothetical protein
VATACTCCNWCTGLQQKTRAVSLLSRRFITVSTTANSLILDNTAIGLTLFSVIQQSSVDTRTRLRFDYRLWQKILLISITFRLWGPPRLLYNGYRGQREQKREAGHSLPSSAQAMNDGVIVSNLWEVPLLIRWKGTSGRFNCWKDSGYYGVTVVAMEATRTIGILANVDCCNGEAHPDSYTMVTRGKGAEAWSWPLTSIQCPSHEWWSYNLTSLPSQRGPYVMNPGITLHYLQQRTISSVQPTDNLGSDSQLLIPLRRTSSHRTAHRSLSSLWGRRE